MLVSVIIRPRDIPYGVVSVETAHLNYEAVLQYRGGREVILATDRADAEAKAQQREKELKAMPEPERYIASVEQLFGHMGRESRKEIATLFRDKGNEFLRDFFNTYPNDTFDDELSHLQRRKKQYMAIADWFERS